MDEESAAPWQDQVQVDALASALADAFWHYDVPLELGLRERIAERLLTSTWYESTVRDAVKAAASVRAERDQLREQISTCRFLVEEAEFVQHDQDGSRDPRYLAWIDLSSLRAAINDSAGQASGDVPRAT